jgi:outer membrane cobalamin receptor
VRNHLGGGIGGDFGDLTMIAGRTDIFEGVSQAGPQNGATERDNFDMSNGLLRWNKEFTRGSLDSSLYFVRTHEGMDGPGRLSNGKLGWSDDLNGTVNQETWVAQTHGSYQVTNNWESSLRMGFTQDRQAGWIGTLSRGPLSMNVTSQLWLGRWQNSHRFAFNQQPQDAFRLIWAFESQQQHAETPLNSSNFAVTNTLISPLLRSEIEWGNWLASSEVRFDHYDQYGGGHTVFNASSGWRLNPEMLIWAKGGTAYRPPAVNELLHPVFGSPTLKSESSVGGEIGWRWKGKNDEISVTGYMQHYDNLILLQQILSIGSIRAANVNADIFGAELQAKHAWNTVLSSGFNYTFMDARDPQTNKKTPYRAPHQAQFWTEWRVLEPVSLRVDMTFRSDFWVDPDNTVRLDSAPRLNASINYQVTPKLRLNLRGENINNQLTPDFYGFNYVGAAVYGGAYLNW